MKLQCTKVRVCRLFFLNTLSLGEDSFKCWTKESDTINEDLRFDDSPTLDIDNTSSAALVPKYTHVTQKVKTWIDLIPKVPSHYCRASSSKLYVESTFRAETHNRVASTQR
ncbi:unnamed protein product [Euphydryas editha]|uniref:Uncharacterized protein n=1 Tax=Euphydryas editha TaxID=104508 RepID=A0AAU9TYL4_EUPED|nr:unnamed protein product [Euphydryas editha]